MSSPVTAKKPLTRPPRSVVVAFGILLAPLASASEDVSFDDRLERLCERMDRRREELNIPGIGFAVVKDDEVVLARGFGFCDVENETPVTEDTLFAIGSTTKAFTSMIVAMLMDEGKMGWDDPVQDHIPFFKLSDFGANQTVTIRDLLCHRTGIGRMSALWYGRDVDREMILRRVPFAELNRPFRQVFQYNNVMYLAAGFATGLVAEKNWDDLIRERIFEPLAMSESFSRGAVAKDHEKLSKGYNSNDGTFEARDFRVIDNCGPAGSIVSSAKDMTQWVRLLLAKGEFDGKRLVSEQRFDEMWEEQTVGVQGSGYGLGWFLQEWNGKKVVEHGGNIDGFAAEVGLLPEENLGFVMLSNVDASPMQQEVIRITFDTLLGELGSEGEEAPAAGVVLGRPGPPLSEAQMEPMLGEYDAPMGPIKFARVDGEGSLSIPGQPTLALEWPDTEGRWAVKVDPNLHVRFETTDSGYVSHLIIHQVVDQTFARIDSLPPLPLTADDLLGRVQEATGSDALEDLGPIKFTGTLNFRNQGLSGEIQMYVDGFDRMFAKVDFGAFGYSLLSVDGSHARTEDQQGSTDLDDEERATLLLTHPLAFALDWYEIFDTFEVDRVDEISGKEVYVVKADPFDSDTPVVRYVDVETNLVTRETGVPFLSSVGGTTPIEYSDYQDVGGVKIPFVRTTEVPGHGVAELRFENVELDVEFPAEES